MNYWQRWIGDWKRKTSHLSACEKGIYGELLDFCYANDTPFIPLEQRAACRIAGASGREECAAVDAILAQFFERTERGFMHSRVAEELTGREQYVELQRRLANRRWDKERAEKPAKGNGTAHPQPAFALPDWIDAPTFAAWMQIRKAKARSIDAQQAAVAKLEKMRANGIDANEVLRTSLANGWQGIFAPDEKKGGKPRDLNTANRAAAEEAIRRFNEEQERNAG